MTAPSPYCTPNIATRGRVRGRGLLRRGRVRVRVRGGDYFLTTSHSIFYSRVGQIAIFSH